MSYQPDFSCLGGERLGYQEFGRFNHHVTILQDPMRVGVFDAAVRASAGAGRRVAVDVGGGSGLLALSALKAGYEKVYYIEPSRKMAHYAAHAFARHGVAGRVVILDDALEDLDLDRIAEPIDLIATETLTSLFLGLGCWPQFEALRARLSRHGTIVPGSGQVYAALWDKDPATRSDRNGGLKLLRERGIDIDLYKRTFWSVGNVFDKGPVNYELASRRHDIQPLVRLDARRPLFCEALTARFEVRENACHAGLLTWWRLQVSESDPSLHLDSRDPRLSTWYPYFIPFSQPLQVAAGDVLRIALRTLAVDTPYPFAFQLYDADTPLSEVLYW